MTVEIEDEGGQTDTALVTISLTNVNENPVVSPGTFEISEAANNGAVVGTVTASDPEGGALTYSILGQTPFAINAGSGQLTVADSSQLDYEADPQLTFTAVSYTHLDVYKRQPLKRHWACFWSAATPQTKNMHYLCM